MAFAKSHAHRRWPLVVQTRTGTPLAEFLAASVVLGIGVVGLSALLSGAAAGPTAVALLVFAMAAGISARALHCSYPHDRLGLCNAITLTRLAMTAMLVAPLLADEVASWAIFTVAVIALMLDGFDGWLARRNGYASAFGARFDMEVDSALALVLAANAAVSSGAGPAAILLGLPRYLFAVAARALPWMRGDLPDRFSRKVVCVLQLGALIALQAPILPDGIAVALVPLVALALAWSFAVDLIWLRSRRA